ncbi:hypothetical protein L596_000965 [Steinernema carpocapsae]|uniref:Uncharacterized protein n=1 Tax=Steinernema carpocapsae TaxID=34508 RepID=A0A4U8UNW2_STECR|nr:hypothetical protein L596_000965 [Steinernema carpocapsae]
MTNGSALTSAAKSRLTRATNKLIEALKESDNLVATPPAYPDDPRELTTFMFKLELEIAEARVSVAQRMEFVVTAMNQYTEEFGNLEDADQTTDAAKYEEMVTKQADVYEKAEDRLLELLRLKTAASIQKSLSVTSPSNSTTPAVTNFNQFKPNQPMLPSMPLPRFSGNLWEFNGFKQLFQTQVSTKCHDDLERFHYLLACLEGKPKRLMSGYQPIGSNFQLAMDLLERRYGNTTSVDEQLMDKLTDLKAKSNQLSDQRNLLDELFIVTNQLETLKVSLDSKMIQKLLREKFSSKLQHKILVKQDEAMLGQQRAWSCQDMLRAIDEIVNKEETSLKHEPRNSEAQNYPIKSSKPSFKPPEPKSIKPCVYCDAKNHGSEFCEKVPSVEDRKAVLEREKRCFICTFPNHTMLSAAVTGNADIARRITIPASATCSRQHRILRRRADLLLNPMGNQSRKTTKKPRCLQSKSLQTNGRKSRLRAVLTP